MAFLKLPDNYFCLYHLLTTMQQLTTHALFVNASKTLGLSLCHFPSTARLTRSVLCAACSSRMLCHNSSSREPNSTFYICNKEAHVSYSELSASHNLQLTDRKMHQNPKLPAGLQHLQCLQRSQSRAPSVTTVYLLNGTCFLCFLTSIVL